MKGYHTRHHAALTLALVGLMSAIMLVHYPENFVHAQVSVPSWTYTGSLNTARVFHTATLLPNGKVLVVGGIAGLTVLNSAELYDPASGQWSVTGSLNVPRYLFTATLLRNGKVLVAGGNSGPLSPITNTAELYDPATGIWSATGNLNTTRTWHSAVMLRDGKVLIAGGWDGDSILQTAEIYDPDTGRWTLTGKLKAARYGQTATLLNDGTVLIAGGSDDGDLASTLASAELYDPATETWSLTGRLNLPRIFQTSTLLPNGKVLVAGGYNWPPTSFNSAELYDPATGTWTFAGNLNAARSGHTATLLANGKVLVAGGVDWGQGSCLPSCRPSTLANAELYDVLTGTWSNTANLNFVREAHTATLLQNGKVLVAGGRIINSPLNSAELYDPGASVSANPIDDPQFFVRQQYRDFLGREPDTIGFQNWVSTLTGCPDSGFGEFENPDCDRVHVSAGFYLSEEFRGRGYWVFRFYQVSFDRPPTYNEFVQGMLEVGGSKSPEQEAISKTAFVEQWVNRADFKARYDALSDPAYVDELLRTAGVTLLARDALVTGLETRQKTRAQVLREIVESKEVEDRFFIEGFVSLQYFGYLRRDVDEIGYANWVQTLRADPSNYRHMIFGFIYSTEYRNRFLSSQLSLLKTRFERPDWDANNDPAVLLLVNTLCPS